MEQPEEDKTNRESKRIREEKSVQENKTKDEKRSGGDGVDTCSYKRQQAVLQYNIHGAHMGW